MLAQAESLDKNSAAKFEEVKRTVSKLDAYIHSSFLYPLPLRFYPGKRTAESLRKNMTDRVPTILLEEILGIPFDLDNILETNDTIQKKGQDLLEKYPNFERNNEASARMKEAQEVYYEKQKQVVEENARKAWGDFEKSIRAAFDDGDITTALSSLSRRDRKDEKWKELCNDILSRTTVAVQTHTKSLGTQFDRIRKDVNSSRESVRLLSNSGVENADEVLRELNDYLKQVDEDHDKDLYDKVKNRRTKSTCDNYFNHAPLKTMRQYVERYTKYLDDQSETIDLQVTATLEIGPTICWAPLGSRNQFSLSVDGKKVLAIEKLSGFNVNKTLELVTNPFRIQRNPQDFISVDVTMTCFKPFRSENQGAGEKRFTINELRSPVHIPLKSTDEPEVKHSLILKAEGFPKEPELPAWKP